MDADSQRVTLASGSIIAIGILPGHPWCNRDFFDSHAVDTLGEVVAVDVVAIANEKTWRLGEKAIEGNHMVLGYVIAFNKYHIDEYDF